MLSEAPLFWDFLFACAILNRWFCGRSVWSSISPSARLSLRNEILPARVRRFGPVNHAKCGGSQTDLRAPTMIANVDDVQLPATVVCGSLLSGLNLGRVLSAAEPTNLIQVILRVARREEGLSGYIKPGFFASLAESAMAGCGACYDIALHHRPGRVWIPPPSKQEKSCLV